MDADSDAMIPMYMWPDAVGEEVAALFPPLAGGLLSRGDKNFTVCPDIVADDVEIDTAKLWSQKGAGHRVRPRSLVNNAGMAPLYPSLTEVGEDLNDRVIGVNLKAPCRPAALVRATALSPAATRGPGRDRRDSAVRRLGPVELHDRLAC